MDVARSRYPEAEVREAPFQGYCSYTLCVNDDTIVQFRPSRHGINVDMAQQAREIYGSLAPETLHVGTLDEGVLSLEMMSMSRLPGVPLNDYRGSSTTPASEVRAQRESLIKNLARLVATGWKNARPIIDLSLPALRGKVGSTLRWRLELMHRNLPSRFRPVVQKILDSLKRIETLPWVLTHGDLVPANIMVDADSGPSCLRLVGLCDWAEAEYLPFGVGLYGLEELLGQAARPASSAESYQAASAGFEYYAEADHLRRIFWKELEDAIPKLRLDPDLRESVELARLLGILLWHGIAFDDGSLDRAVEIGRDEEEIEMLDLLLFGVRGNKTADPDTRVPVVPVIKQRGLLSTLKGVWQSLRRISFPGLVFRKS